MANKCTCQTCHWYKPQWNYGEAWEQDGKAPCAVNPHTRYAPTDACKDWEPKREAIDVSWTPPSGGLGK